MVETMDGLRVGETTLFLTEIPNRKGLVFVFEKDGVLFPVAYVNSKLKDEAVKHWKEMLGEFK